MRVWCVAATLAASMLVAGTALAQKPPTAQQKKAAKAHFQQGKAFYEAGAWDDAIREYQKAYALVPLPDLMFNIGQACRMKGDKPRAIEAYQRYLDKLPEGPLADEARSHVAALKLRIQVEEAEAARKKALEEAAAARRRADDEAAARKRAEADAAARGRTPTLDEERFRQIQAEEAEKQRLRRAAEEAEQARRVEEARKGGGWGLRLTGNLTIAAGCVFLVATVAPLLSGIHAADDLKSFDDSRMSYNPWTTGLDDAQRRSDAAKIQIIALAATGTVLIVAGSILYAIGAKHRTRAVEAARRLGLAPVGGPVGPTAAALGVVGRF